MNPFSYPEDRIVRRLTPGPFRNYHLYKPYLREEFSRRCVYCRLPDGMKGLDTFGIDHYRPMVRFPAGETEYNNLFYACNTCNRRKGTFWPDEQQRRQGLFLPNPCDHRMADHLSYRGGRVEPASPTGSFALELLQLNTEEDVTFRERMLRVVERCWQTLEEILHALESLEPLVKTAAGEERDRILHDRERLLARLNLHKSDLESFLGAAVFP
jgi:5-methylcytosine-specific restriction endonuclease McrA